MNPGDQSEVWKKAVAEATKETPKITREVLVYDKQAVRQALHDAREQRGVRVRKSILP